MIRLAVGAAGLAATLHMGFASVAQWKILVEHWGDPAVWEMPPWELRISPLTNALSKGLFK